MFSIQMPRLKFFNIYLGNLFEHYDTALYSFLSPFFAEIFFPKQDILIGLILTFAMLPLGKLARPIGSLFFGYIGDIYGRERALFLSFLGMGISTFFIGMLPTYYQLNVFAPILLLLTRISQNFFAAGENIGGAIYILEKIENENEKNFASSVFSSSTIAGILLASAIVSVLYHFQIVHKTWRFLYFGGAVTAIFGSFMRHKFDKSVLREPKNNKNNYSFFKNLKIIWQMPREVLAIIFAAGFSYATYSMAFVLMNAFVPLISDITKSDLMKLNTLLLILDFVTLPIFGLLTTKFSRNNLMSVALIFAIIAGIFLFLLLDNATLGRVIFVRICIVIIGVGFSATFHSWAQSLISFSHRYTVISFAYSIGALVFGTITPVICLWIFKQTKIISSISWYWIALAITTSIFLFKTNRSKQILKNEKSNQIKQE